MDYAAMGVGNMAEEHAAEGPLAQIVAGSIEELLARGSERGYVTYDELSATLPLDQLSSEEIEDSQGHAPGLLDRQLENSLFDRDQRSVLQQRLAAVIFCSASFCPTI